MDQDGLNTESAVLVTDNGGLPFRNMELWYSDGTVILRAENTLFRVHQSVLCNHSQIFSDMFGLSQPEGEELMEGCPVICLPDSTVDVTHLLQSLYDPFFFSMHSYLFDYMSAILRLSTKYNMSHLRQHAVNKLKQAFPSTLHQFDEPTSHFSQTSGEENVFAAIVLARQTNCPELLPCAFYYCSRLPVDDIINGDGVYALTREDALLCLMGRDKLLTRQREVTWAFLYRRHHPSYCEDCPFDDIETERRVEPLRKSTAPYPLDLVSEAQWETYGFCTVCAKKMIRQHKGARERLWIQLPEFFGLGSWARLQEQQNE